MKVVIYSAKSISRKPGGNPLIENRTTNPTMITALLIAARNTGGAGCLGILSDARSDVGFSTIRSITSHVLDHQASYSFCIPIMD